jgi:DNA-cytosine methyltransferase
VDGRCTSSKFRPCDWVKAFVFSLSNITCRKKVHFEVTYPISFVIPQIEQTNIVTGWNADDHYGNTANVLIKFARLRREGASEATLKAHFDKLRQDRYQKFDASDSLDTFWFAHRIAVANGQRLIDPYTAPTVRAYFSEFCHQELSDPRKPLVRAAFADALADIPEGTIAAGVKLQKGGQVDKLFESLIDDPTINRFEKSYRTMSMVYQRWGSEVQAEPDRYMEELRSLPPPPATTVSEPTAYRSTPYLLTDVHTSSDRNLFTVMSLFAGGGGSSIGYRKAGGRVLAVNEFIPEAARTYARNFPDTLIDCRDVRELIRNPSSIRQLLSTTAPGDAVDIIDGSPPCSEFSPAGKGSMEPGLFKAYSDGRQRDISCLPFEYARIVQLVGPKVAVMENVPALATRGKEVLSGIGQLLTDQYFLGWRVLDASDFGVPQKRRRLFLLAVRKDVAATVGIAADQQIDSLFPKDNSGPVSLREAFAGLNQTAQDLYPWVRSARVSSLSTAIARLPRCPTHLTRPQHLDPHDSKNFTLTRCSWDLPVPTLTVTGQQPSGLAGAVHLWRTGNSLCPNLSGCSPYLTTSFSPAPSRRPPSASAGWYPHPLWKRLLGPSMSGC